VSGMGKGVNWATPARIRWRLSGPVREKIDEFKKRELLLGQAEFAPIEACISPQCKPGEGAVNAESLSVASKEKHQQNITRPRFFGRWSPNYLWQR
jgi:hypothetical protein